MDKSLGTNLHLWHFFTRAKRTARREFIYVCSAPPPHLQCWKRVHAISLKVQHCTGGGGKATHFETENSAFLKLCFKHTEN